MTTPANYATLIAEIDVVIESYGLSLQEVFGGRSTQPTLQELIDLRYELFEVGGSGGIDLTAPTTNIGTVTPPAITVSTLFRSANTGNVAFVAQPFGTGAFQLQQTDNTVTGGNARGANAIDLQTLRNGATQVASGTNSFAAGAYATASGASSVAISQSTASGQFAMAIGSGCIASGNSSGAFGATVISSGGNAFGFGLNLTVSGEFSFAVGSRGTTKGVASLFSIATNLVNVPGATQTTITTLGGNTTDATPTVLKSNASTASATNQLVLLNNSSAAFTAIVTASTTAAGDCSSWKFEGQIQRGANAASTALVAAITPALITQKAGASTWAVAVTADTTNGCLAVTVTGQAATTIRWTCTIFASEVAF